MIQYKDLTAGPNFFLMAGPCAIEDEDTPLFIAERIVEMTTRLGIPYIFKGSYRKANRSRVDSFTGIGDEKALHILRRVRETFDIPVVTDIHETQEAALAAEYVDVLQIPAFLCRQTDLIAAAARTGKIVNIKKGQFLSASGMEHAARKVTECGNDQVILTERGNSFGYSDLVVDFTNIPAMRSTGFPAVMDVTHSLQRPNQASGVTGGKPALIETIAKAAIAVGADGLFFETHPDPASAKSDGANMLPLDLFEGPLHQRALGAGQTGNLGDVLRPDVEGVDEAACHRQVGRVGHRRHRLSRVQRVDEQEVGSLVTQEGGELSEIVGVTGPPRPARAGRVQLRHDPPAPVSERLGQIEMVGGDRQRRGEGDRLPLAGGGPPTGPGRWRGRPWPVIPMANGNAPSMVAPLPAATR